MRYLRPSPPIQMYAILVVALSAMVPGSMAAQAARGSVMIGAYVLPSPERVLESAPSVETGYTMVASASIPVRMSEPPRTVAVTSEYVEISVTVIVSANVASRLLVQSGEGVSVRDRAGAYRDVPSGTLLPVADAAPTAGHQRTEIRYRVTPAQARERSTIPLQVTLQASPVV